ncbi:uncharacterized protein LOC132188633 isoform X1 [Corylus avellana]|uniref:uncharacterized protein LOC132188633 isoform X1 n=1 Tax=Corylus avellana TaxID=13451 RepID=UPI001E22CFD8|nr:uncharacterized protein LOC132188633 isoform X1 [Corylus avellana]
MAETKVTLKLLIDTRRNRVLFAEADKKFVDFLFSIFTLPIGTVTKLLQKQNMPGSLYSLYKSIENLSDTYIQPGQDKDFLLNPKVANISGAKAPLLLPSVEHSYSGKIYKCTCSWNNCPYVSNVRRAICPSSRKKSLTWELRFVDPPSSSNEEAGFVNGLVTYMVMDDLVVKPLSAISGITGIKDVEAVEEKVVDLGLDEGVKLLKASLQSKTVLTDVFLRAETTGTGLCLSPSSIVNYL